MTDPDLVQVVSLLRGDRFITALTKKKGLVVSLDSQTPDSVEVEIEGQRKKVFSSLLVRPDP
jgi:hypothetical protein